MDILKQIEKERGMVARIYSDFSKFPQSVAAHYPLNKALMLSENAPLARAERELLAYITSEQNENEYCGTHHKRAFENYEKEIVPHRVTLLKELAIGLTSNPDTASKLKEKFIGSDFTEAEWQHAVNIVAYFNFTNRLAFAMDMRLEEGFEKSCN
ncbi:MAG: hypothetical protein JNM93_07660 [Bacteriovoracaceae bacterium]|nr:hypothetical protein [Bacteriovoracaceae bacterium]